MPIPPKPKGIGYPWHIYMRNEIDNRSYCPICGSLEIEETSDGSILCKNKNCLAVTPREFIRGLENE